MLKYKLDWIVSFAQKIFLAEFSLFQFNKFTFSDTLIFQSHIF